MQKLPRSFSPDPYACWAKATQRRYLVNRKSDLCRLALRVKEGRSLRDLAGVKGLTIPGVYREPMRHCSAQFDGSDRLAWRGLLELADVALAEPGSARPDEDGPPPLRIVSQGDATGQPPVTDAGTVIGVIDGACGFAHRRFRERAGKRAPWTTRLVAYWDQQHDPDRAVPGWTRPADLGYGRELSMTRLNELFRRHLEQADTAGAQAAAERAIYRALNVALPEVADWTHGTHVLDTAGGMPVDAAMPDENVDGFVQPVPRADVGQARLIHVQLPEAALRDTSGRWIPALVLDGLRYIVSRAGAKASIVVNLSLGSFAGPHDGSSMIEEAIDALIEELQGRLTVVVAAGNAGKVLDDGDGTRRRIHARHDLDAAGGSAAAAVLELDVDEADGTETFVELWLPPGTDETTGTRGVHVTLQPPRQAGVRAAPGQVAAWTDERTGLVLAQVVNLTDRQGSGARGRLPMALVAIGSTRNIDGVRAPLGRWRIVVANLAHERVRLEAWVERRDVPGELSGERPQYGFHPAGPGRADDAAPQDNTLGSLANGARTVVVLGALAKANGELELSASSARRRGPKPDEGARVRGPQRPRCGPSYKAASEFAAAGFLSGSHKTLKGTSMAAAWVTRAVAAGTLPRGQRAAPTEGAPGPAPETYIVELPPA